MYYYIDKFLNLLYEIYDLVKEIIIKIVEALLNIFYYIIDIFKESNFIDKLIIILSVFSILVPVIPIARFKIFDIYYYVNNPLAVYLIFVLLIVLIGSFYKRLWLLIIRVLLLIYYGFWIIYIYAADLITKANVYEIYYGYYVNIIAIAVLLLLCLVDLIFEIFYT